LHAVLHRGELLCCLFHFVTGNVCCTGSRIQLVSCDNPFFFSLAQPFFCCLGLLLSNGMLCFCFLHRLLCFFLRQLCEMGMIPCLRSMSLGIL
jgi:hypothetical protein